MKRIYKFILLLLASSGTLFYSCETIELEQLDNPNALTPDKADPDLLLNNIQLNYRNAMIIFNDRSADLARIDYMFGRNYFNNFGSGTLNGPWGDLYSDIIPDIAAIEGLVTPDNDLAFHRGVSKIMQAHIMMQLVDFLGDIVYSEANNPEEYPTPNLDDDEAVYAAALDLLSEAKSLLNGASAGTALDLYYGGDADKWIKLANTLEMRANLTVGNYTAVINATNVIETSADDFEFKYGTNEQNPDTRHPDYNNDYRDDGANIYQSNWLMHLMAGTWGDFTEDDDPRRRYYFYRQNANTPGANFIVQWEGDGNFYILTADPNGETLSCSLESVPTHLEFTPDEEYWCAVKLGYWGRMHGDDDGTPPDNFTRTASGVYPAGGRFDDNPDYAILSADQSTLTGYETARVGRGLGAGGQGIEPIYLSSYVEFMRAEAYLATGNTSAAADHFEAGIRESIAKVQSFGALDSGADLSLAPDETRVENFVTDKVDEFNNAPVSSGTDGFGFPVEKDKFDILGEQYFIAMYGGAGDAYNFIRRTGYPRTLARNLEPNPGPFPRTFLYPGNEVIANPNIQQRTDNSTRVFWDTGVTNPAN